MFNYLNLGCGLRFLPDWINIDFVKTGDGVIPHNLVTGIPLHDHSVEVVYHSHVLEHFEKKQAERFISECHRVLKPNGIIRIAVPDLEQIVRLYIQKLEMVLKEPNMVNKADYDWSVIELYDQTVRNKKGGEMKNYWSQEELFNEDTLINRTGGEYINYRKHFINMLPQHSIEQRIGSNKIWKKYLKISSYRQWLIQKLSGEPDFLELLDIARFRIGGEVHQWMYDRYSLKELLLSSGFRDVKQVDAFTSRIDDWDKHAWLDVEAGTARKPDSLFMEASK